MKHFKLGLILTFLAFFVFACSQNAANSNSVNNSNTGANSIAVNNTNSNRVTQNINGTTVTYDIVSENTNSDQSRSSNK